MSGDVAAFLVRSGLPAGDPAEPVASTARFRDGGQYKWEVAGAIDGPAVRRLVAAADQYGVRLHQITNTVGTMRLLDDEIRDLVAACAAAQLQLRVAVGPRGLFDIGGQKLASSAVAAASAYRLRGMDALLTAADDVLHAVELGVRGFLVFDEGSLVLLAAMRREGVLPNEVVFKASSNMGAANPLHVRLLAETGADSVNVQRDLDVRMVAAIRATTAVPLDVHTDNPRATGGFVRGYDVPELVRVGAPVYLKSGNAAQDFADEPPTDAAVEAIVRQIALDRQLLLRLLPDAIASDEPEF